MYLTLAAVMVVRNRRHLRQMVRDGFVTPYEELARPT
jgi:hypothetical protein